MYRPHFFINHRWARGLLPPGTVVKRAAVSLRVQGRATHADDCGRGWQWRLLTGVCFVLRQGRGRSGRPGGKAWVEPKVAPSPWSLADRLPEPQLCCTALHTLSLIHTCTCTHSHSYIHTHICLHTLSHTHMHILTLSLIHTCLHTLSFIHACTCSHMLSLTPLPS